MDNLSNGISLYHLSSTHHKKFKKGLCSVGSGLVLALMWIHSQIIVASKIHEMTVYF